jgi:eukaryotic-like serine/threonine-protein kinase
MPKLVVLGDAKSGSEYMLDGEKFTMGRRKSSDIPVADAKSSRDHAEIIKQGSIYYLRDLGSRNGTFVNGTRVSSDTELSFGDEICIGDCKYQFQGDNAGKPIDFEISGYSIEKSIGEGGMGVVYKARQVSMDRVVALKVLSEKFSSNTEFIDRFIREARSAGRLNHPNVIHVHDVSKTAGRYFFSMEFIDGPTIKKLLKDKGVLPPKQSLEIVTQAARALEFAHENGIVHRDVKPDNIMLTSEGVVKLGDLGIAKSFDDGGREEDAQRNRVFGTPHYMSPEQALGKAIDRRADVYSLGATFYHMLTGKTPFSGKSVPDILKAHVQDSLEPIQHLNDKVPEQICFVVERMMAKTPDKRYENMTRLLEDLEKAIDADDAEIKRIPPGESSIMQALPKKLVDDGDTDTKTGDYRLQRRRRHIGNLLVMLILLVLAVGALLATYFVVKHLQEKPDKIDNLENNNGGSVVLTPSARMLSTAKAFFAQARYDEARTVARQIVNEHAGCPEVPAANKIIKDVVAIEENELKAEMGLVEARIRKFTRENSQDLNGIMKLWNEVLANKRFAGTTFAADAKKRVDILTRQINRLNTVKRRAEYKIASDKSEAFLRAHDYTEASKVLLSFAGFNAGTEECTAAESRAKEIEAFAAKRIKDAETNVENFYKSAKFASAIKELEDLQAQVKSSKWLAAIPAKIQALKDRIKADYQKDSKAVFEHAKAGKMDGALKLVDNLEGRFRDSSFGESATRLKTDLESLPKLRAQVVAAIKRAGPKRITFEMDAALLGGVVWSVSAADEKGITISGKKLGQLLEMPLRWPALSPKDTYNTYILYLSKPSKACHGQIAFFCRIKGLKKEADFHSKKAE